MALEANFSNGADQVYTETAYQWDKGQKLTFTGIDLGEEFEVHFSNQKDHGTATTYLGHENSIYIPDAYFYSGEYVYCWIYVPEDVDSGSTVYMATIPVRPRPVAAKPREERSFEDYDYAVDNGMLIITEKEG